MRRVQGAHGREVGDLDAHGDALALLGADLLTQDLVQKVQVGGLLACGVGEQRVELLGHPAEVELGQVLEQAGVDELAHWRTSVTAA